MKNLLMSLILLSLSASTISCVKGDQGPAGPPGSSVVPQSLGRIVKTINCSGVVSGLGGFAGLALNGLEIEYDVAVLGSGDVYATANIIDQAKQTSGTSFYASGQNGATDAAVIITVDYDGAANGGYFDVRLDRQTLVTTALYTDSSLGVESPATLTFTPSACSVNNW